MSHSIKLYVLKQNMLKHGTASVNVCITINGKRKYFPTGLKANENDYDFEKNVFTAPRGEIERKNALLRRKLSEFDNAVMYLMERNIPLTFENIEERLSGNTITNFVEYARKRLHDQRKQIAFKTYQQYEFAINVVANYDKDINVADITPKWLTRFKSYMELKGYQDNSVNRVLSITRKFLKIALSEGIINDNPFESFKIGKASKKEIEYLDEKELQAFEQLLSKPLESKFKNTLLHFLHSCYTGLRAVDQRKFNADEHVQNDFIVMQMQKTKLTVRVPLNDKARKIHPLFNQKLKQSHSRLADDLKQICTMAGINKHITYNCSRHTFAIHSLIKGVPLEVVSKWLGHTSVMMTQNYAKVVDSLSTQEMKKWNSSENEFLKIDIVGMEGRYKANVFLEGKAFDFPAEEEDQRLLKKKVLMKLANWYD